jgi:FkbM family methyltransferase
MTGWTRIVVHGRKVVVNTGYAYPAFARRWPTYNDPLVELLWRVADLKGRPIHLVDVGAAVGDTALLALDAAGDRVDWLTCVEPDAEFFTYLTANLGEDHRVSLHHEMLSGSATEVPDLVRTHSGTASAQGAATRRTTTLDALLRSGRQVDLLKVDTDGYDGAVLDGARTILQSHQPAVIFEWHPILIDQTRQDLLLPFQVLADCGYDLTVWFTKEGEFSHFAPVIDEKSLIAMAGVCRSGSGPRPDWHYDVVAVPVRHPLNAETLAGLQFARQRPRRRRA